MLERRNPGWWEPLPPLSRGDIAGAFGLKRSAGFVEAKSVSDKEGRYVDDQKQSVLGQRGYNSALEKELELASTVSGSETEGGTRVCVMA